MSIALGGCRLSDGRLHIGHYHGCFGAQKLRSGFNKYFFVVQDSSSQVGDGHKETESLLSILAELYALDLGTTITVFRQSQVFPEYSRLFDSLLDSATCSLLEDTHPNKSHIANRAGMRVKDYLFPIEQVAQILATGATDVVMNDDNLRFVHLARRLRKTVMHRYPGFRLVRPTLLASDVPRLIGANGKKISKGNRNALFLEAKASEIQEYVAGFSHKKRLFACGAPFRLAYQSGDQDHELPELMPLVVLHKAFCDQGTAQYRIGDMHEIASEVTQSLIKLFSDFSEKKRMGLAEPESLLARLEDDEVVVRDQIRLVLGGAEN
ncbi:hypothetical protein [Ruegeria sp. HKCCSA071]|uniref:hypothetical protein n=1 Tax=Ruegeria sp. HKCCSA071 TaxID=2794834 RepID=UPI001AE6757C|nr:hypothetical protein [Ruegeria sp. HKCCSA071]